MSTSPYAETLEWLYALEAAKGMDFKLERVALALQRLGDPHRAYPSIHIAGTNGKGSVAAMLHATLTAAGHRVGLYTSPHLVRFTERILVGYEEISEAHVVELAAEVRRVASGHGIELTFFEFVTVVAFLYLARCGVDLAVIEVGLGGRLDATNVIDPLLSVITTIGLDHMEYLGDSITGIAAEKGGIIKPGRPVVIGELDPVATDVVERIAAERQAPLLRAGRDYALRTTEAGIEFEGPNWAMGGITLGLPGSYQRQNAATALAALAVLRRTTGISDAAVRSGLARVRWPGRFETVGTAPLVLLDGAHNAQGMAALVREIEPLARQRPLHAVFAVMRDKHWDAMVEALGPLCATAIVTEVLPPRAESAQRLAAAFERYCPVTVAATPAEGWSAALARAAPTDLIIVTGSLFLVGAVYPLCTQQRDTARSGAGTMYP